MGLIYLPYQNSHTLDSLVFFISACVDGLKPRLTAAASDRSTIPHTVSPGKDQIVKLSKFLLNFMTFTLS